MQDRSWSLDHGRPLRSKTGCPHAIAQCMRLICALLCVGRAFPATGEILINPWFGRTRWRPAKAGERKISAQPWRNRQRRWGKSVANPLRYLSIQGPENQQQRHADHHHHHFKQQNQLAVVAAATATPPHHHLLVLVTRR